MKTAKLLFLLIVGNCLVACGGGSSSGGGSVQDDEVASLMDMDLTGTWQVVVETQYSNKSSSDYLYSYFHSERFYIEDTANGLKHRPCEKDFGYFSPYGVKTEDGIYLDLYEEIYQYQGNETFVKTGELESYSWYPENHQFRDIVTLTKISDEFLEDGGTFELMQPFAFLNEEKVCVESGYSTLGTEKSITVRSMYQTYPVTLSLSFYDGLPVSTYEWVDDYSIEQIMRSVDFGADSELLEPWIGSSYYYAEAASVTVAENSETTFSVQILLEDENNAIAEGAFEIDKAWLNF